ncbi:hypothetical protein, partial [Burkholderia cepacia]|uniref:hypothetical protein n=1 Tax=Burkholderia cepacia TaxID=292 RepID=UPI0026DF68AE
SNILLQSPPPSPASLTPYTTFNDNSASLTFIDITCVLAGFPTRASAISYFPAKREKEKWKICPP